MQRKKSSIFNLVCFVIILFSLCFLSFYYVSFFNKINSVESLTYNDIETIEKQFRNGIIKSNFSTSTDGSGMIDVDFKLFNIFKVKSANKQIENVNEVYIGGDVFDFHINLSGVLVKEFESVETPKGKVNPFKNSKIKVGDLIIKINDQEIDCASDFVSFIEDSEGQVKLTYLQNKKENEVLVEPAVNQNGTRKLGIWVKDDALGTGTVGFVDSETNNYFALGHQICDSETGSEIFAYSGNLKKCRVVGVRKSQRGVVGELKTISVNNEAALGTILSVGAKGISGKIENEKVISSKQKLKIASAFETKIGKAQIYCCLNCNTPAFYDVEIVKVEKQKESKNLCIKITDKTLLDASGGIVQGLSGAPIVQNGKLVGVLTHCFINDPARGFGLLASCLI